MKLIKSVSDLPYALMAMATVAFSSEASAQSRDVGTLATDLKGQFGSLGKALVAGAFFVGIVMVITGLIKLKAASENPNQTKYSDGLWRLAVGAGLIGIPAVTGILGASLGIESETRISPTDVAF
ncbi:hypothetical protein [Mesorhizobium sp. SP-1A]|uniref:hypothetical protein n=1 Tax=Mesorhizobium sp. SP-1A TaxID=3077840 RepID=UPI0028F6EE41|nr:hypothetical protein [Mesorhizobium sp. SP-1A]